MQDLRLDLGEGAHRQAIDVPIYIGATGPKMLELAGEPALQKDISLYQEERNVAGGSINWRITGQDARCLAGKPFGRVSHYVRQTCSRLMWRFSICNSF